MFGKKEQIFTLIWEQALPYLKKGVRKDFVVHTFGVIKAMELLLKKEKGDRNILIPAAILHDTGWAFVPILWQKSTNPAKVKLAMKRHLIEALPISEKILKILSFDKQAIKKIKEIILAHKFCQPRDQNKKLLIDADTLSDIFSQQFYTDCQAYKISEEKMLLARARNKFYTETAKNIFQKEFKKREKEIFIKSKYKNLK